MKAAADPRCFQGFTLIEMIMVITIMGIVGTLVSMMAGRQMEGYIDTVRRAALVSTATAAITKLERDIRTALPNSVRVSGNSLELVPVQQVVRYREAQSNVAGSNVLDFSAADASFQILGNIAAPAANARAVVYNVGLASGVTPVAGLNVYAGASTGAYPPAGAHVITPTSTTLSRTTNGVEDVVTFSAPHRFSFASPRKRMFLVSTALSYVCDLPTQRLLRYRNYALQSTQPVTTTDFLTIVGASSALASSKISACSFSYQPGTPQQSALVTVYLKLEDAGEIVELLHQIHVDTAI